MRKKLIISACLLLLAPVGQYVMAQGRLTDRNSRLLDECRSLFSQADYSAAGTLLEEWEKAQGPASVTRTEETEYMRTVILAELNPAESLEPIQRFLADYPESMYTNRMQALMGSAYFAKRNYNKAVECFDETDPLLLDDRDCRRMVRHNAISLIRVGRVDEGYLQLSVLERLVDNPQQDEDIVFYKAFVDYANDRNDKGKAGFEESLEYSHADEARLYLADIDLMGNGDHSLAYETARQMTEEQDDPVLKAEAERILGEYWYRKGEYEKAKVLLSGYMSKDLSVDKRHDMYMLGMSCFNTSDMEGAMNNLSYVADGDDEMAQNAALHVGLAALKDGNKDMARMSFERASSLPGKAEVREQALYNYAMIIHETSFSPFAESVKSFERFLNEFPNSKYADQVSSYLVDVYLSTTSYDAALASIDKIRNPGASILAAKMQLLYNKAMDQMAAGQCEKVPDLLTSVISLERYDRDLSIEALFWRGEAYYRLSDLTRAEADYQRYIGAVTAKNIYSKSSVLANYGLGYILYDRNAYADAVHYFNFAASNGGRAGISDDIRADACLRAGDCYFHERKYDQAKDLYSVAGNTDRSIGDYALYQTALVNGLQRNYSQKIQNLDFLIRDYPESAYLPSALYEQGRAYQQTDDPEQALRVFGRIVTDYPNSDLARKAAAETALIYYQTDRYNEAIKAYKEVVAKYPGSDEARTALVDLKSIYVERGDINAYVEYTQTLQGAAPIAVSELDSLTYTAAEGLFSRGAKAEAKARFSDYLSQFPDGAFAVNAWYYQGLLLEEENDYEKAYESYMHVAAFENSRFSESALDHAASMAWYVGDWETAMDTYMRLYNKTTDAERQRRSLYCIVSSAGKIEEWDAVNMYADKALQKQLSNEQRTEVSYYKAKALLSQGNRSEARPLLEELSKDTRSQYGAESDYLLGQMLYDSGDKEGAEKVVMAFIKEGTPHMYWLARSFVLLSDIYKSQGKDVEARQYLLSLKSNYTENDDIAEMIAERLE